MLAGLARLRESGDLLVTLSVHRVKVRYKQSHLGIVWALVQPLAMMLVFMLMFTFLRTPPTGGVPVALFTYSALVPWTMFSAGLVQTCTALTGHAALMTKVYFPREILPLTYIVAALVDMAVASVLLGLLMAIFGVGLTATAFWAAPAILLLIGFLVGLGLLASALQVRYRDVGLAMPVLMQVWLFATPVLYPLSAVQKTLPPPVYALYIMNPMAGIIDGFRRAVVMHQTPDLYALAMSAFVVAVILPSAYAYFKRVELTMADVV